MNYPSDFVSFFYLVYEVDEPIWTVGLLDDGAHCWGVHDIDVGGRLDNHV